MIPRALFALACALLFVGGARDAVDRWINATDLPPLLVETSKEVRARDGRLLRAYMVDNGLWRLNVSATQVDQRLIDMLIAYEDKRFYSHGGIDGLAMLRAGAQAVRHGRVMSGGSTLTMQVARLLEDGTTGRWAGKLRQARVALLLERRLSKVDILNLYLLLAPYGGNIEGVRAASLGWFGKEPTRLTPAQAALLVALPQSPETRRPDRHLQAAIKARGRVLARMVTAGVVSRDTAEAAETEPVTPQLHPFPRLAPHLTDRMLAQFPDQRQHVLSLNRDVQANLENLAMDALQTLDPSLSIAIMAMDHRSGQVMASVGSASYAEGARQGFVDMTQAVRSPGSTLKPLVYGMSFDQGLAHPETLIADRPISFDGYAPQNFDGQFRGELRVADALRQSLNIPVIMLTDEIGPARLMATMRRAGMQPDLPVGQAGLAVALGGVGVTLEDLMRMYAALAQGGKAVDLTYEPGPSPANGARVISRSAAWHIGHILSGIPAPPGAPQNRVAYKTGTSYGHRDTWAIGYDGAHVVGVWIGRADGTPVPGAFGAELAAPVLFQAFQRVAQQTTPLDPPPPETIMVSTAQLPQPLQRFRGRRAVFLADSDAPKLAFPPNGAMVSRSDSGVVVKLRDGVPPFTVLANGVPLLNGVYRREITVPLIEAGFSELSVIDAQGRADRVRIELR